MSDDLQPIGPREAMEMWLERQQSEKADETIQSYRYRMERFVEWCESEGIDNMNVFDGRTLYRFDSYRRSQDLTVNTLKNQMGTLRLFLRFCEDIEAVEQGLSKKLDVPSLSKSERANEEKISMTRASELLDDLARYRYAGLDHVMVELAWETGARLGGLRALDVGDVYLDHDDLRRLAHEVDLDEAGLLQADGSRDEMEVLEEIPTPFVFFRHRPETETPLKNQMEGERPVSLRQKVGDHLREYIEATRPNNTDEYGREPLFTTAQGGGRMSKGSIRRRFNLLTQPCRFGGDCPHGREIEDCEAREHMMEQRCPSSRSPHRVRTGSITAHRDDGWPPEDLAERVNATPQTIRDHYDHPEMLRRMRSRRSLLGGDSE